MVSVELETLVWKHHGIFFNEKKFFSFLLDNLKYGKK